MQSDFDVYGRDNLFKTQSHIKKRSCRVKNAMVRKQHALTFSIVCTFNPDYRSFAHHQDYTACSPPCAHGLATHRSSVSQSLNRGSFVVSPPSLVFTLAKTRTMVCDIIFNDSPRPEPPSSPKYVAFYFISIFYNTYHLCTTAVSIFTWIYGSVVYAISGKWRRSWVRFPVRAKFLELTSHALSTARRTASFHARL